MFLKKLNSILFKNYNNLYIRKSFAIKTNAKIFHNEGRLKEISWENALPFEMIPGPSKYPIIGMAHHFLKGGMFYKLTLIDIHKKINKEYGNIALFAGMIGKRDIVTIYDPDDIELVFRTEGKWPVRNGLEVFDYFRKNIRPDVFKTTGGLLIENGEKWQEVRTKVNPIMLQPKVVQRYIESMDDIAIEFLARIKNILTPNQETPSDFLNELSKFALETVCWIAMEKRLGTLKNDFDKNSDAQTFIQLVHDIFEYMFQLDVLPSLWKLYPTPTFKKMMKTADLMTNLTMKYIDEAIEKLENIDANSKTNREAGVLEKLYKIDRNVAVVMAIDMLMAGVDTTSGAISTILYMLAKNPEKQEKLREEVFQILPNKSSRLNSDSLKNVPYLRACIKESMRLHPVTVGNFREIGEDLVIKGYRVPKGTPVAMATAILQIDEKHVKRSREFIPERWLRNNEDSDISMKNTHPFVYLPFGFGPRTCIGKRFAELEIETLITRIIRNFKVEWHHPDITYGYKLLNIPNGELKYKLIELNN